MSIIFWTVVLYVIILKGYSYIQKKSLLNLEKTKQILDSENTDNIDNIYQELRQKPGYATTSIIPLWINCVLFTACFGIISLGMYVESRIVNKMQNKLINTMKANSPPGPNSPPPEQKSRNIIEILGPNEVATSLKDVAGLKEAKQEVTEIIQYLKSPQKFMRLGAKPPKGVLMYGPPGTGKTLMARAIAGEAGVTFISVSGSQFEEEYVGVGASRVRQLFAIARKHAPCIIFIDEIDSVASKRRQHDISSTVQTLNQLLSEMDGLNPVKNRGIIVIGASNRIDVLDKAILRPGRFDRQMLLPLPNLVERQAIINIHAAKVRMSSKVDLNKIAKTTPGFSGADLQNLVNEATIYATQKNKLLVDEPSFEAAKDKIILGTTKDSIKLSEQERKITAYHEAGHALVGIKLKHHDPVYKVTITPRGKSLGHTSFEPQKDYYLKSKLYLENQIASALGGRIAEEMIFGKKHMTTGASSDFQAATQIAYLMVTEWGFSDKVGTIAVNQSEGLVDKKVIEEEVKKIINYNYSRARKILEGNKKDLDQLANALLEKETLSNWEIKQLLQKQN